MIHPRSFFMLLFSAMANLLWGQGLFEKSFQRYTTASGMSSDYITGVVQDATGYIWSSTTSGVNRFDGNNFVQFHSTDDSLSIGSEETNGMTWLNRDMFAVYTSGLHVVNTKTGETRNIFIPYHNKQYQYKFNLIMRAAGDEKGNVYVLGRSGFYHFDKNDKLLFRYDAYKEPEVFTEHFFFGRELVEIDSNRFLITSLFGLYIYDKQKRHFKKLEAADCPPLAEFLDYPDRSYAFLQQKAGHLFILKLNSDSLVYINTWENKKVVSTIPVNPMQNEFRWRTRLEAVSDTLFYLTGHFSGFYKMRFYPESGKIKFYPEKYFQSYLCNSLIKDKEDHLWIATNKGLLRQDVARSRVELAVLPSRMVETIADIRFDDIYVTADKIYAGTRGPGSMFVFDKKTLKLDNEIAFGKAGKPGNLIRGIAMADSNSILLGGDGPLILFNHKTGVKTKLAPPQWNEHTSWVSDLFHDSKGYIWVSAYINYKYHPPTKSFKIIPYHERLLAVAFGIEEDRDGHIWMSGHGVARYNTTLEKFDLLIDSFPFIKMPNRQVGALAIDPKNVVWFNSVDNGLVGYDINKKTFRHFTRNNGLPDNNLSSMIVVDNYLWMAAPSGIACMNLSTYEIKNFGKEDGFPATPVMKGARFFYDKAERKLYIGFLNTVVRFDPYTLLQSKKPPHVFIENLAISNKMNKFLPDSVVTTSWKSNEVTITIGNINFSDATGQAFAYRILKDEETPWQQLGSQPSFSISNLSPGRHRIQAKTFSLNNQWPPQVKEISVVVLPPFWKKDWFVILLTVAISVLLYLFIRWRTGIARKKEMEKTRVQKLIADDYKNQFELEQISNYFSSSLADKKTQDEVLWDVAGNLIGKMNYVDCMIYLWNEDKTKMVQKAAFGLKGNPEFISANVFDVLPGQGVVGHVIQTRQPILVTDTREDQRYRVDEQFRLSEVCVPIIHDDELMGIIDSEHHEANYFSERDIKILTTIATLLGNKLKQIESDRSLEAKGKEIATINEQLVEARLSALQAQMNPHFVFNALNSIKRMILDGDNEKASRYLSKFALMIRMTLNHSKDTFVTLDENIEYLKTYLEMERLRFDDSFTYKILVAENIDTSESSIPSLMIQPLVENAIWHGLLPSESEKKILIKFTQNENRITCIIEDNGIGIRQSEKLKVMNRPLHNSVGLENLRKRIKIMNEKYDTDCSLEIFDLKETGKGDRGTKVVLRFNLI
jgi:ligand-binding sensor domain-containing protein/putative methionine-R-sulfoxide reductase with GAF domain